MEKRPARMLGAHMSIAGGYEKTFAVVDIKAGPTTCLKSLSRAKRATFYLIAELATPMSFEKNCPSMAYDYLVDKTHQ